MPHFQMGERATKANSGDDKAANKMSSHYYKSQQLVLNEEMHETRIKWKKSFQHFSRMCLVERPFSDADS